MSPPISQGMPLNFPLLVFLFLPPLRCGPSLKFSTWQQLHSHSWLNYIFLFLYFSRLDPHPPAPEFAFFSIWKIFLTWILPFHHCISPQHTHPTDCSYFAHTKLYFPFTSLRPLSYQKFTIYLQSNSLPSHVLPASNLYFPTFLMISGFFLNLIILHLLEKF